MRVKCPRGGGLSVWALCLLDWKVVNTTDTPVTNYHLIDQRPESKSRIKLARSPFRLQHQTPGGDPPWCQGHRKLYKSTLHITDVIGNCFIFLLLAKWKRK